jgi:hypothetical protein
MVTLNGAAAKGPFQLGTTVNVAPVDSAGNTTGTTFSAQTSDNAGDFSVQFSYQGPVQLSANGYYYNEMSGGLSSSLLTLYGLANITASGAQNAYINVLTDIEFQRIKNLMGSGSSLVAAATQADGELYGQLAVGGSAFIPGAAATQLNLLGGNNPQAAYLLAASSVIEQAANRSSISGGTDAKVQQLINTLQSDFATAGTFKAGDQTTLQNGLVCVEPDAVMASLQSYFTSILSSAVVPNINLALDTDGDNVPNATDTCVLLANADQSVVPNGICNYKVSTPPALPSSGGGQCTVPSQYGPISLIDDFDNANGNDLLISACTDLFLWLNQGGGTFAAPTAIGFLSKLGVTLSATQSLNLPLVQEADMNDDGNQDILVQYSVSGSGGTSTPEVVYLPGDGAGHFSSAVSVYTPPACLTNGAVCTTDGECCSDSCHLLILTNDGGTTGHCQGFGPNNNGFSSGTNGQGPLVTVADLNGDDIPDIAGFGNGASAGNIQILLSGGGTWTASTVALTAGDAGAITPTGIVAYPFRTSANVDLVVSTSTNGIYFLAGDGTGSYSTPASAWTGLGTGVLNVFVSDVDVDGYPDLIATVGTNLQIQWGNGTFTPSATPYTVDTSNVTLAAGCAQSPPGNGCGGTCPIGVAFGDVTGDGKPDMTTTIFSNAVLVNSGSRTFAPSMILWTGLGNSAEAGFSGGSQPLVDMNGDGIADLVETGSAPPPVALINLEDHFTW